MHGLNGLYKKRANQFLLLQAVCATSWVAFFRSIDYVQRLYRYFIVAGRCSVEEGRTGATCPDVAAIGHQAQLQREGWTAPRRRVLSRERGHPYLGSDTVKGTRMALRCRTKQISPIRDWQMCLPSKVGPAVSAPTTPPFSELLQNVSLYHPL